MNDPIENKLPVHYRYEDGVFTEGFDQDNYNCNTPPHFRKLYAIRETPCGYWLRDYTKHRWVSKTSRIRFAYPTKEEAKNSYVIRKQKQLEYAKNTAKTATYFLYCLGEKPWERQEPFF